jgi:ribosome-binding ATPase YchF (GTP1/OBG family)
MCDVLWVAIYLQERQRESPEDFEDYLNANPRHRSAVGPIFFQLYRQMDLIRFYTVDKYQDDDDIEVVREIKIWFCQQGTYAPEAAGRILTDMERYVG